MTLLELILQTPIVLKLLEFLVLAQVRVDYNYDTVIFIVEKVRQSRLVKLSFFVMNG